MLTAEVWQALFAHPNLDDSLAKVAPFLATELGAGAVLVRHVELGSRAVTTQAYAQTDPSMTLRPGKTECTAEQIELLLGWTHAGRVTNARPSNDELLALLVGSAAPEDAMAAPLVDEQQGLLGALVVVTSSGRFTERHRTQLTRLIDPFRAAHASAHRLHELARLREVVEAENRALLSKLDRQEVMGTIVGAEAGFREVMTRIAQVAPTDAPVLLLGETGTGKEVAARAIHRQSRRNDGPMLRVNCGAIPPGLVDSELFGHERGSFTGAVGSRTGWFERADGGTLFLDELGELPLAAQVRLLRVIQEGVLERVGGQRAVPVDVRIVAATHCDLGSMVETGRFRQDLWYRVSVFPIWLPPLRERRRDIPELAAHFAWHAGRRLGGQPLVPSDEDLELLVGYQWPGNVRELAAVIERAAILGNGKRLEVRAALGPIRVQVDSIPSPVNGPSTTAQVDSVKSPLTLDAAIARHIEAALTRAHGKIEGPTGAAALLAINPQTLRSKMRKLGIRWQRFRER